MKRGGWLWMMLLASACGSGSTQITGMLDGKPLQAHYAIAVYLTSSSDKQTPDIVLSPRQDMCTLLQRGEFAKSTDVIEMQLYANNAVDNVPTSTGVYPVVENPNPASNPNVYAMIIAGTTDTTEHCLGAVSDIATHGAVNISQLGGTTQPTVGTFDTTFPNGKLAGFFYAMPCLINVNAANGDAVCDD